MNFEYFGLPKCVLEALQDIGFNTPTEVQQATIPAIMHGDDILISSQTGTGKTGAFAIPVIAKLMNNIDDMAIIITPTRELATQVMKVFKSLLTRHSPLRTALLIGGEPIYKQLQQLKQQPNIIVGTPGRINDHLNRKKLQLSKVKYLVLDETDRMLDMGFSVQIDQIIKYIPKDKQAIMLSATLPDNITDLSKKYMRSPKRISIGATNNPVKKIKQDILNVNNKEKYPQLLNEIENRKGSIIIFVKTKNSTEIIANKLSAKNYDSEAIHGDLKHHRRAKIIKGFHQKKYRILVATDLAARGLDIPHIQHVINYDLPQCPEDYIHRIGRTARAGQSGAALSFIGPADNKKWQAIQHMINPELKDSPNKKITKLSDKKRTKFLGKKKTKESQGKHNNKLNRPNQRYKKRAG